MRRLILSLTIIFFLISCGDKSNKNFSSQGLESDSIKQTAKAAEFLNLFKNIEAQKLHIYTIVRDDKGELIKTPFEGVAIDVKKFPYINYREIFFNLEACKNGLSNIYAIAKFDINESLYGLIMRQYSQYDETLVQLMLWDKNKEKIINYLDLSDSFGDAGWYFTYESWIVNFKYNEALEIVSRRKDNIPTEEGLDSITTDTLKINKLYKSSFTTKILNQKDTIKFQLRNWK